MVEDTNAIGLLCLLAASMLLIVVSSYTTAQKQPSNWQRRRDCEARKIMKLAYILKRELDETQAKGAPPKWIDTHYVYDAYRMAIGDVSIEIGNSSMMPPPMQTNRSLRRIAIYHNVHAQLVFEAESNSYRMGVSDPCDGYPAIRADRFNHGAWVAPLLDMLTDYEARKVESERRDEYDRYRDLAEEHKHE